MENGGWRVESGIPFPFSPLPLPFSFFLFSFFPLPTSPFPSPPSPFQDIVQQGSDALGPGGGDQAVPVGRREGRPVYKIEPAGQSEAQSAIGQVMVSRRWRASFEDGCDPCGHEGEWRMEDGRWKVEQAQELLTVVNTPARFPESETAGWGNQNSSPARQRDGV